jgi:hypothetical protein
LQYLLLLKKIIAITIVAGVTSAILLRYIAPNPWLPHFVQKQLLIDIENSGGIAYGEHWQLPSKTASLLNKRPEIYGTPGSQIRDKVTNKLQMWKKYLSQDEYYQLLKNFGIAPFIFTTRTTTVVRRSIDISFAAIKDKIFIKVANSIKINTKSEATRSNHVESKPNG